ncbi:MAG: GIY-YIG nuclease family protein, partial [Rhodospirillaceae bacterium]|nr:GIY-YIG nuclease family protein [Rhodospirillaceae bacterium]
MTLIQTLTAPIEESALPAGHGAYALLIRLPHRLQASIGALGMIGLPAGAYLYLGSAHGPGGLRARLRRHLRPEKTRHWHVDYLTEVGKIICILAVPDGHECDLVDRARSCTGVSVPIAGFGSSDCRRCPAHLLSVERDAE